MNPISRTARLLFAGLAACTTVTLLQQVVAEAGPERAVLMARLHPVAAPAAPAATVVALAAAPAGR
ncbi:hypothetical protein [uncultured Aquincola sp.]|uniref:hypothetical protein n=1 Tax=uncultured Aquincola sp. TaxID=886556 RepID=UPI0032B25C39|tara:strand:+ start:327 stop:524 length:198 start_codon:yes stop_codon:yes gene_type:complete